MLDLILALATWRISKLLISESGPYEVLAKLRDVVGITYNEHSLPVATNELAKLFLCIWCMSIWVGLLLARGSVFKGLAYSAGAILFDKLQKYLSN